MRSPDYRARSPRHFSAASARIAWRDLRSSPAKFLFAVAAVALGFAPDSFFRFLEIGRPVVAAAMLP